MINDGGVAFPAFIHTDGHGPAKQNAHGEWEYYEGGMTLRDWFAGNAPPYPFKLPSIYPASDTDPMQIVAEKIVKWNFAYADAMLAKRGEA